jgi:hypothetical protein
MDYGRLLERAMAMGDRDWARHANPWSVWTRVPILPALALAVYSRAWLGWWALLPVALLLAWTVVNPRAFPPPARLTSWASRATLGERLWLARRQVPVPAHHVRAAHILTALMVLGVPVLAWGLIVLDPWATVAGLVITVGAKLWFVDRMVWLHDEVTGKRGTAGENG